MVAILIQEYSSLISIKLKYSIAAHEYWPNPHSQPCQIFPLRQNRHIMTLKSVKLYTVSLLFFFLLRKKKPSFPPSPVLTLFSSTFIIGFACVTHTQLWEQREVLVCWENIEMMCFQLLLYISSPSWRAVDLEELHRLCLNATCNQTHSHWDILGQDCLNTTQYMHTPHFTVGKKKKVGVLITYFLKTD